VEIDALALPGSQVRHAGVIDDGDPEGVVPAMCPYPATTPVSEPSVTG
jgi:hypothetical protein